MIIIVMVIIIIIMIIVIYNHDRWMICFCCKLTSSSLSLYLFSLTISITKHQTKPNHPSILVRSSVRSLACSLAHCSLCTRLRRYIHRVNAESFCKLCVPAEFQRSSPLHCLLCVICLWRRRAR